MAPPITNINVVPGPTSVTINWDVGVSINPGTPRLWNMKSASGISQELSDPSVTINYTDLNDMDTIFISTHYFGYMEYPTRVFFYTRSA